MTNISNEKIYFATVIFILLVFFVAVVAAAVYQQRRLIELGCTKGNMSLGSELRNWLEEFRWSILRVFGVYDDPIEKRYRDLKNRIATADIETLEAIDDEVYKFYDEIKSRCNADPYFQDLQVAITRRTKELFRQELFQREQSAR
jgi:hypothetical protein